jgi:hypothetical protein
MPTRWGRSRLDPGLGHQAEVHEGHPEQRGRGGVGEVRMQEQRRPDAHRDALDGRDERRLEPGQPPHEAEGRCGSGVAGEAQEIRDVVAGGEGAAGAGEKDRADPLVAVRPVEVATRASYMAPVTAFFFSGRARRSTRTPPSRCASTWSVIPEPSARQREGRVVNEAGAGHHRLLQAARPREQVLGEEAAERDAAG